ncbi:MAG: ABC transporter substrate-binding protein [Burkholderiaceae bacterium]|nr:ABC transporter substrate-binding protein [Burkholderiaceae bacterium]
MRIVSLVPSLTELLCQLGLREQLVGRTGFCIHPRDALRDVPRVGGTKDVDIERVRALAPTHVVVNVDENEKPVVDRIAELGPEIVVTHPITVDDNLALIESFGERFDVHAVAQRIADRQREAVHRVGTRRFAPVDVLYLIWKDPWMSIGRETFIAHMLAAVGLRSVVTEAQPRYPQVDDPSIDARGACVVLLSSEPYRFLERHRLALQRASARSTPMFATIDGEMTSWYGTRAIDGLHYLLGYRDALDRALDACGAKLEEGG